MNDHVLRGWKEIADFLRVNERTMQRRRKEMLEAGVIFYQHVGRGKRRMVFTFASFLKVWIVKKGCF